MPIIKMYKPGLADSTLSLDPNSPEYKATNEAAKSVGGYEQKLKNSGYIFGEPPIPKADSPVSSTTDYRNNLQTVQQNAQGVLNDLNGDGVPDSVDPTGYDARIKAAQEKEIAYQSQIDEIKKKLGIISPEEQSYIDSEGAAAGAEYDSMIAESKLKAKKGNAVSLVGAGERGGFMSTQYAGKGALTDEGSFVGRGGELENIASAYDLNIDNLQAKKLAAVAKAKAEARKAVLTGQQQNLDNAIKAKDEIRKSDEAINKLLKDKADTLAHYETQREVWKKDAEAEIKRLSESGIPLDQISYDERRSLETKAGWLPGTLEAYYDATQATKNVKDQKDLIDAQDKILSVLQKVPIGQKIEIAGSVYEGTGEHKNNVTYQETDGNGTVTIITVDKSTGRIVNMVSAGAKGKTKPSKDGDTMITERSETFDSWLEKKKSSAADQAAPGDPFSSFLRVGQAASQFDVSDPKIKAQLEEQYKKEVPEITRAASKFTSIEWRKLEQAGLLNADRQSQLDYLYGQDGEINSLVGD